MRIWAAIGRWHGPLLGGPSSSRRIDVAADGVASRIGWLPAILSDFQAPHSEAGLGRTNDLLRIKVFQISIAGTGDTEILNERKRS